MEHKPHNPPPREHPGHRAARYAFFGIMANILLAMTKGIAGVVGHSYALIADAMESGLDIFASLVVLTGLKIAAAPPDEDHPYGHGKAEPLASIVVALGILTAAVVLAAQSIHEIMTPHHAPAPFTLGVLVGVVAIKEGLYRWLKYAGGQTGSSALVTDAWHQRSDALTSLAAFIGISVALFGGHGFEAADDYAALAACTIIAYNGLRLLRPSLNEVMDAAPDPGIEQEVRRVAQAVKGVQDLDLCKVRKMGFDYFVDLHVCVNGELPVREGHAIAHRVKEAIFQSNSHIRDVLIHIEPND